MKKTRVCYPVLWAFFAGGVLIGTVAANLVPAEALHTLGIYRMNLEQDLAQFSAVDREWIFYVLVRRIKFWAFYLLLCSTAVRWAILSGGFSLAGGVAAVLFVTATRTWGFLAIAVFWGAILPHSIAYAAACLFVVEALRIQNLTNRSLIWGKLAAGTLCWCAGIASEIFLNPALLRIVLKAIE